MKHLFTFKGQGVRYPNEYYKISDLEICIVIYSEKYGTHRCIIDLEDFERVKVCNWKVRKDCKTYYILNSRLGFIHRLINKCPSELCVDHIDGDGLNNRKVNLCNVTTKQNNHNFHNARHVNITGELGVVYEERYNRYRASWAENGKCKFKNFPVGKYGKDAFKMACEFRKEKEKEIYNNVYTERQV